MIESSFADNITANPSQLAGEKMMEYSSFLNNVFTFLPRNKSYPFFVCFRLTHIGEVAIDLMGQGGGLRNFNPEETSFTTKLHHDDLLDDPTRDIILIYVGNEAGPVCWKIPVELSLETITLGFAHFIKNTIFRSFIK